MAAVRHALKKIASERGAFVRQLHSSAVRSLASDHVLDTLASRSLLSQVTAPNSLRKHLQGPEQRTVYVGVDPSADSLHIGNLLPLVAALHFVKHGHRLIVVVGGATGSIGDPSGRDTERTALSPSQLAANVSAITRQIHTFFQRASTYLQHRSTDKTSILRLGDWQNDDTLERTPMQEAAQTDSFQDAESISESAMDELIAAHGSHTSSSPSNEAQRDPSRVVSVINNEAFYKDMNVLTFLRDVGKLARVGTMLARDSVKSRMQSAESTSAQGPSGLSFTEFSYQLLQAYDYSVLHRAPWHCTVQLGGSDQMGNIMAGVDLIRRQRISSGQEKDAEEMPAYGLTLPLLTTASGAKFGKSAGNAVWLSSEKCSDYDLYQFFYRSRDDEVALYLKTLTMLSLEMIDSIMRAHKEDPSARRAQKILAAEVTELIRGKRAVARAQAAARVLFETQLQGLQVEEVLDAFQEDPRLQLVKRESCLGADLTKVAVDVGLASSKSEARRAILHGGFYLNNAAVHDAKRALQEGDLLCDGRIVVLRSGRTEHRIIVLQ